MFRISRFPFRPALEWASIGAALLKLGAFRTGTADYLSVNGLNEHLRQDIGLPRELSDPVMRHLHW